MKHRPTLIIICTLLILVISACEIPSTPNPTPTPTATQKPTASPTKLDPSSTPGSNPIPSLTEGEAQLLIADYIAYNTDLEHTVDNVEFVSTLCRHAENGDTQCQIDIIFLLDDVRWEAWCIESVKLPAAFCVVPLRGG